MSYNGSFASMRKNNISRNIGLVIRELKCFLNIQCYIKLLLPTIFKLGKEGQVLKVHGLKISVTNGWGDKQIIREVFCDKYYNNKYIQLRRIKTMVDLGGHKGYVSLLYTKLVSNIKVVALEPEADNYKHFKKNIQLNSLSKNIKVLKNAVWEKDCTKTFYKTNGFTAGHTLYEKRASKQNNESYDVECLSLQTIMRVSGLKSIDLLKIDVEGAEYNVLFNLNKTILKGIKYIVIECHEIEKDNDKTMRKFLEKNGFEVFYIYEDEASLVAVNKN